MPPRNRTLPPSLQERFPCVLSGEGRTGLVSVIIPVYNRADLLRRALESVIAQTWPAVEVIVVDDGSAEDIGSATSAFGPKVRLVRQANAGVTAARNRGLGEARGEYIAFLDSDDSWDTDKLATQLAVFAARPELVLVWTDMRAVNELGITIAPDYLRTYYDSAYARPELAKVLPVAGTVGDIAPQAPPALHRAPVRIGDIFGLMLYGNLVHTSTAVIRRSRVTLGGGFDPVLARSGEDYEFHWRTSWFGPAALIDAPLVNYRVGAGDQLSSDEWAYERARSALIAVSYWLDAAAGQLNQSAQAVRLRRAELQQWCGERRVLRGEGGGLKHLVASLRHAPFTGRTWALLALGLCPPPVRRQVLTAWFARPGWMRSTR